MSPADSRDRRIAASEKGKPRRKPGAQSHGSTSATVEQTAGLPDAEERLCWVGHMDVMAWPQENMAFFAVSNA